ncbi:MAG: protoheme IX farnesyltransferase [Elusimicrobia bacterium]|nr:protoheme IX farnesyltransferase [Elusimicrobiota bacterium]
MRDYIALAKPRIGVMVMATTALGFLLSGAQSGPRLWWTALGAGLASGACGALNQWLERRADGLMKRTAGRPLPAGRIKASRALAFGLCLCLLGLGILRLRSGKLPCLIAALTVAAYVLAYTPLKRMTPHTTWIGAAAGAAPPLIGWAAGLGHLSPQAWVLFGIQFLWQIPHFLSLFWLYREDYARAGFQVMPVVDPAGGLTAAQIAVHSLTVLLASLMPIFLGMAGVGYGLAALLLSTAYLGLGLKASWTLAVVDTRRLFLASLAYLPILFGMLLIGGV